MGSHRTEGRGLRVGIDGRSLQTGPPGIATYVSGLLDHIECLDCLRSRRPSNNFLWNQLRVPPAQLARSWDAYHAAAYTAPLVNFCPLIVTIHDVSYLVNEAWYPYRLDPFRRLYYVASLKRADLIIVPSEFSRLEVSRLYPRLTPRIRRIHQGVSTGFYRDEGAAAAMRREIGLPERFLLHVGDIHERRNLSVLAEAAGRLHMPLVLVGRVLRGGEAFSTWPWRLTGLTRDQLRGLYSAAAAFVYPSRYEGFGLPILEAMACGLPVIASNLSCLPEVCGEAAVLVEPSVEGIIEGVRLAWQESGEYIRRGLARAREFTWAKTAAATLEAYQEIVTSP